MAANTIPVVHTGTANTASVLAALRRAGASPEVTTDPETVRSAERLVLPGVGAFGPVVARLRDNGLDAPVRDRVQAGRPTLAICLGLQVLATSSSESPGVEGLGVLDVAVDRFPSGQRVPQLGWNTVAADPSCRILTDGAAYFANSYRLIEVPEGWSAAWSEHSERFVAALERGPILACQFHPELSGPWGARLLERWLEVSAC